MQKLMEGRDMGGMENLIKPRKDELIAPTIENVPYIERSS